MSSTLKLAQTDPVASDFSKDKLAEMKEVRALQNTGLIALFTGESDSVPIFTYTYVEDTLNPGRCNEDALAVDVGKRIEEGAKTAINLEINRRGNLRMNKSIEFPDNLPMPGQTEHLQAWYDTVLNKALESASRGDCLFWAEAFISNIGRARGYRKLFGADIFMREQS